MGKKIGLMLCVAMVLFAGTAFGGDKLSVALIIEGQMGDESFYDSANRGFEKAKAELGIDGKVIECNYDPANYVPLYGDRRQEVRPGPFGWIRDDGRHCRGGPQVP